MEEIWKDVPGYEGLYQISNKCRIKSLKRTTTYFGRNGVPCTKDTPEKIMKLNEKTGRIQFHNGERQQAVKVQDIYDIVWNNSIVLPEDTTGLRSVDKTNRYGMIVETYPSVSHAAYYNCITRQKVRFECNKHKETNEGEAEISYQWSKTK